MKRTKKVLSLLLMAALILSAAAGCSGGKAEESRLDSIKKSGKITVATEPYFAPYEFIDTNKTGQEQYQGADMQLARYIGEKLGVEVEIVPLEWGAVLTGVTDGKYDMAVSGMAYTAERAEAMELSDTYFEEEADKHGLVVLKENVGKYKTLSDFDGLTVAYQSGTLQEQYTNSQIKNVQAKPFDNVQNAVLAVQEGKADAAAVSYDNGELFCASNDDITMAEPLFESENTGTVVACPKGETELIAEINKIIAEVKEKGLYVQWWDEAVELAKTLGVK